MPSAAITIEGLSHRYGDHIALHDVSVSVDTAQILGLLGPNGSGKTTLFRILSTLLPVQSGTVSMLGHDLATDADEVRGLIGVTFQSPSLDSRLTVIENLRHQAHLYGITGNARVQRIDTLIGRFDLEDRRRQLVGTLSGGLKRRVELAKGLLHEPRILLLDEPSTGLDPGARHDLWCYLRNLQSETGVTVLVTTHLMEEADKCDRIGILDEGQLVAFGMPEELRAALGGNCLTINTPCPDDLADRISAEYQLTPSRVGDSLRIEHSEGHELLSSLMARFSDDISSVSLGKPTLEDVFIARTGHRFRKEEAV